MPDIKMLQLNSSIQASSLKASRMKSVSLIRLHSVAFGLIQIVTIVPKEAMKMLIGLYD